MWRRVDLHIHTRASSDYQEPGTSFLAILQKAEERGLDLIAFTDHNSVRGYADLWREIEDLELLEYLGRMNADEQERLDEYRRLLAKIVLLPGFEFTATFGFHILAIFPETTTVRKMEHLLLSLGVPEDRFGRGEVGATSDVLAAYRLLSTNGALVIGAHANSANGVAMQGIRFGGQTKIAYTQDEHLDALEVTDLDAPANRRSTARFFNGSKPEYPRRMHCIQGSDAHRLDRDPLRPVNLGIGERATDLLLPAASFAALKALFRSTEFGRVRPARPLPGQGDLVKEARIDGPGSTIAFHEHLVTKKFGMGHVLRDIVAFANGAGGTIFVGASAAEKRAVAGVEEPTTAPERLQAEIAAAITPLPPVTIETIHSDGKPVLSLKIEPGAETPYALAPGQILVRRDAETIPASRDEIVAMVRAAAVRDSADLSLPPPAVTAVAPATTPSNGHGPSLSPRPAPAGDVSLPTTGVEIVDAAQTDGIWTYAMHDLRTGEITPGIRKSGARGLWRYAIEQREGKTVEEGHIRWKGNRGFWKQHRPRVGDTRYNLALKTNGKLRIFYGVTLDGADDDWRAVLPTQDPPPAADSTGSLAPEPASAAIP